MYSFWSKRQITKRFVAYGVIFIIISLIIIYFLNTEHTPSKNSIFLTNGNEVEVHFFIFIATVALAVIALIEFERSNQLNTNEILTFISNRWSSKEIIKARQIIHELFVYRYRYDINLNAEKDFKIAIRNTSLDVYEMSKKLSNDGKNFVYLLNLLDHFENVCYLHITNEIDIEQVKNIYGNNIKFYYQVLEKYIEIRQIHHPKDFKSFTQVYKKLI